MVITKFHNHENFATLNLRLVNAGTEDSTIGAGGLEFDSRVG